MWSSVPVLFVLSHLQSFFFFFTVVEEHPFAAEHHSLTCLVSCLGFLMKLGARRKTQTVSGRLDKNHIFHLWTCWYNVIVIIKYEGKGIFFNFRNIQIFFQIHSTQADFALTVFYTLEQRMCVFVFLVSHHYIIALHLGCLTAAGWLRWLHSEAVVCVKENNLLTLFFIHSFRFFWFRLLSV